MSHLNKEGFIKVGDIWIQTNNRFQAEGMLECMRTGEAVFQHRSNKKRRVKYESWKYSKTKN